MASFELYRHHNRKCLAGLRASGVPAREVRKYISCDCVLWLAFPGGRKSLETNDWKKGEAIRAELVADGKDTAVHGPQISECIRLYLDSRKHELSGDTLEYHELLLNRLRDFMHGRDVYFMREITVDLMERFQIDGLKMIRKDTSRATAIKKVRVFLREAERRGWITEDIVRRLRPFNPQAEEETSPFTEEEIKRLMNGALTQPANHWQPATFRLFLEFLLETGMRVGDALLYDPRRTVKSDRLWIYSFQPQKRVRTKRVKTLEVFITDRLKREIDGCQWMNGLPFHNGKSAYKAYWTVYKRLQLLGARVGVEDARPHRFRDSFACRKLLGGMSLDDVSQLLGHSSVVTTQTHYAKFVPSRARRLERIVAQSLEDSVSD